MSSTVEKLRPRTAFVRVAKALPQLAHVDLGDLVAEVEYIEEGPFNYSDDPLVETVIACGRVTEAWFHPGAVYALYMEFGVLCCLCHASPSREGRPLDNEYEFGPRFDAFAAYCCGRKWTVGGALPLCQPCVDRIDQIWRREFWEDEWCDLPPGEASGVMFCRTLSRISTTKTFLDRLARHSLPLRFDPIRRVSA